METKISKIKFEKPNYLEWLVSFNAGFKITAKLIGVDSNKIYFEYNNPGYSPTEHPRFAGGNNDVKDKEFDLIITIPESSEIDSDTQYTFITGDNGQLCADHYLVGVEDFGTEPAGAKHDYDDFALSIINWRKQ